MFKRTMPETKTRDASIIQCEIIIEGLDVESGTMLQEFASCPPAL